tara:strand:+ start:2464 stop:4173 length:1710 start_codon:yes stop_codon:yes gene_type:complete
MAQWRKVIVSGSNSELNNISSSGDFVLSKDGAKMKFGADNEVTLTHQHNDGLLLSDQSGIGTTKLSFGDTTTFIRQQSDGVLGIDSDTTIEMSASAVSMSDDLHVGGDIFAVGNITFQGGTAGTIQLGDNANDNISAQGDFISDLIPNADDSFDLGSDAQRWNNLYLSGSIIASGGPHNIDSATTIDIDSVGATSIDAGAASNLSTSAGDLTLEAGATNAKVVIKGDHESATAVHIDGNANAASIVDIDAGVLDIDSAGNADILAGGTMTIKGAGVSKYGDDTGTLDFSGTGAVTDTGVTTYNLSPSSTFDIDAVGAVTVDSDAGLTLGGSTVDVDADGGTLSLDGSGGINIGHTADVAIDIESSTFDIDASAGITIDGTTVSIDGTAASNVTVTGNDLTLSTATSGNVIMDSAGTVGIGTTSTTGITIGKSGITTTINGDLDVNGTLTTIDSTNLQIQDKFIQVASGSTSSTNGGLIVNTTANGSGSAFYYDGDVDRWALTGAGDTGHTDLTVTPRQFVSTVSQSAVPPGATPGDFGNSDSSRRGMIHIQTGDDAGTKSVDGDIWIYS